MAVSRRQTMDNATKTFPIKPISRASVTKDTHTDMHTVCNTFHNCVCCNFKFSPSDLSFYGRCPECESAYRLDVAKSGSIAIRYSMEND